MNYEWDESKRVANIVKHGVDFTAAEDFDWSTAMETIDNRFTYNETRWIALGRINKRVYVLIYTERRKKIRLISLRKANKREIDFYEKNKT
jgi:uncharacterized DUF497 family protein